MGMVAIITVGTVLRSGIANSAEKEVRMNVGKREGERL
jgi:hypothetical protein